MPALSLFCGVSPAQEQRCFEVGNTDISTPISEIMPIAAKDWIPGADITRLNWGRYFSAVDRIRDSRLSLHSSRLSMWERMMRSFSACSAHISPSTAASTCSSVAFMPLVRKPEISVIFSVGSSRIRAVIAEAALPNTSENTSSSLKLETVRQFCARFFSPVVKLVSFQR